MDTNASINRLKIAVGAITFEIEGGEDLVREGMTYAKENILTKDIHEIAERALTEERKVKEKPEHKVVSVRDYCNEKNPRTDMERVTVLADYARQYRDTLEVSESELVPLFNEVGVRLPKDVTQALRNAARKQTGYLEFAGRKGYYRITNAGINLVNYTLPRSKKQSAK